MEDGGPLQEEDGEEGVNEGEAASAEDEEEATPPSDEQIETPAVVTLVQRQQQPGWAIPGLVDGFDYAWQWK